MEGTVQIVIMLAIGGAAGAASFTHVHNVAAAHGQPGWLAWADAIVLELMSIASGLELRRRKRAGTSTRFPATVLACAVTLSLAAQVVEAEPSPIGWIAAAVPALGFLVMVKIALGYADTASATDRTSTAQPAPGPVDQSATSAPMQSGPDHQNRPTTPDTDRTVPVPTAHANGPDRAVRRGSDQRIASGPDRRANGRSDRPRRARRRGPAAGVASIDDLLPAAREVSGHLAAEGRPLTRATLAAALRAAGHTMSNTRASHLLKALIRQPSFGIMACVRG
ncbi:DUF2637 domain-containing protein [Polymorphospora sp. NPDC050346]|uniref:DUF2637 domain-containing protein n=1 Tax=Polymorphospora sp. NPDC050346 TaxID=3155780 RepID=UPI0034100E72